MEPKKFVSGKHQYTKWGNHTEVRTMSDPKTPAPAAGQVHFQVEMDDATAQGVYANLAAMSHTETEFLFDFLFVQPNAPKARLRSRVISSPVHAKRVLAALADNVRKYEERFGPINAAPPGPKG